DLELDIDSSGNTRDVVCRAILAAYPISKDDEGLRQAEAMNDAELAAHFDALRKKYWQRREFSQYTVLISANCSDATQKMLAACGFNLALKGQ
ncbi:MAG: DUF3410 domain-containing protein, partial [Sinobacterium sp.]